MEQRQHRYPVAMDLDPLLDASSILHTLGMVPHPEGGWYAETYRAPASAGTRSTVTAIYFLLQQGKRSHWHSVDACEIWLWHAGAPLLLHLSPDGQRTETIVLGPGLAGGERPQAVVPTDCWQAAESTAALPLLPATGRPGRLAASDGAGQERALRWCFRAQPR